MSQIQIGQDIVGEAPGDQSGLSMDMSSDGSIVAIGAPTNDGNGTNSGHVRIYENQSGNWTQVGNDIEWVSGYLVGSKLSLSPDGNRVAISTAITFTSSNVRVFENISGTWTQVGNEISYDITGDEFGFSMSLSADGSIVALGAPATYVSGGSGAVKIYEIQSGIWTQIGSNIDGEAAGDQYGWSVSLSLDGSIVAIGSVSNDENGNGAGHVRVFKNINNIWTQIGSDIFGGGSLDRFGASVSLSLDGSIVAIGAASFGTGVNENRSGYVSIYENQSNNWTQIGSVIDSEAEDDLFGKTLSLSSDGSIVAIGAPENDGNGNNSGHVRIYENQSGNWTQVGNDIDGAAANDQSGWIVSLSSDGSKVATSAFGFDGNTGPGTNLGHVRVYDLSALLSSDEFVLPQFSLYPNPAKDRVTIDLKAGLELQEILIYNNLGQQIMMSKKLVFDTSSLNSGLYYLQIKTDKGYGTKKLIIE